MTEAEESKEVPLVDKFSRGFIFANGVVQYFTWINLRELIKYKFFARINFHEFSKIDIKSYLVKGIFLQNRRRFCYCFYIFVCIATITMDILNYFLLPCYKVFQKEKTKFIQKSIFQVD